MKRLLLFLFLIGNYMVVMEVIAFRAISKIYNSAKHFIKNQRGNLIPVELILFNITLFVAIIVAFCMRVIGWSTGDYLLDNIVAFGVAFIIVASLFVAATIKEKREWEEFQKRKIEDKEGNA